MSTTCDQTQTSEAERRSRLAWPVPLLVAGVTCLVFVGTLWNGFVNWDDQATLVKNSHYRDFSSENLWWMLTSFHVGHWRPVTWLSFALDYQLWGMNPAGYHLTNVLLHSFGAGVFCLVIHRLLRLGGVGAVSRSRLGLAVGLGALVYSVHPLRVECVAWATDRLDVLSGLWWMLAVWGYLQAQGRTRRTGRWLTLSLVFYTLSMMSKGMGMTLPAVLLILDVYPLRRLGRAAGGWIGRGTWKVWLEKVPFGLIGAGGAALAFLAKRDEGGMLSVERLDLGQRIAQMFYNQAFFLWKTIWPSGLVPLYPARPELNPLDWPFVLSAIMVVVLTGIFFALRNRCPGGLAVWAFYLIVLLPVSGLVQSGTQIAADRYSYLPCLGWSVLLAAALAFSLSKGPRRMGGRIACGACSLLVLGMGALSIQQAARWKDSETLWRYTISVLPRGGAYNNLGVSLTNQDRMAEARDAFEQALTYQPFEYEWRTNLADALYRLDRTAAAAEQYEQVVRNSPQYTKARRKLLRILIEQRTYDRAIRIGQEGLRYAAGDADYLNTLAWLLATCPVATYRDGFQAVLLAQDAVNATKGTEPMYLGTLAAALAEAGEYDNAVATVRKAIHLAEKKGMSDFVVQAKKRLAVYETGRPYHEQ